MTPLSLGFYTIESGKVGVVSTLGKYNENEVEAIADANIKISKSVTNTLIDYNRVEKWSGDLPKVTGGEGLNLFLPAEYGR